MTTRGCTLREETIEELKERGGQEKVDNVQQIINEYLMENKDLVKEIILFFAEMPVTTCKGMGVKLVKGKESQEDSKIFFEEFLYQYKKRHPEFHYGGYYRIETDAEKKLFEKLGKNLYVYDIIMEELEKKKNCKEKERQEILKYLNSNYNLLKKYGLKKVGIGSWVTGSIMKAAATIGKVFEEMTRKKQE